MWSKFTVLTVFHQIFLKTFPLRGFNSLPPFIPPRDSHIMKFFKDNGVWDPRKERTKNLDWNAFFRFVICSVAASHGATCKWLK